MNPHAEYTRRKLHSMRALCLRAVRLVIAGQSRVSLTLFLGLPPGQDLAMEMGNPGSLMGFAVLGPLEGPDCTLCSHPFPAPPPGLRGTLDLQVIRVRMEEPPAVSLLQDWSKHPQGTKGVGTGDNPDWPTVLSESSSTVKGQPEAGNGV